MSKKKQTLDDWAVKNGIILFQAQGETKARPLCTECGSLAYSSGPRMCPKCFAVYFAKVLRNNTQMVAIHAACYSSDGPVITHLERVRTPRSGVYTDTNPSADHSHWYKPEENFTYCNEQVSQDWVDAMRYAMNSNFHPGMNWTFRTAKNRG